MGTGLFRAGRREEEVLFADRADSAMAAATRSIVELAAALRTSDGEARFILG
jgi:hypothetical protein